MLSEDGKKIVAVLIRATKYLVSLLEKLHKGEEV